jgi:hypothetical protein
LTFGKMRGFADLPLASNFIDPANEFGGRSTANLPPRYGVLCAQPQAILMLDLRLNL